MAFSVASLPTLDEAKVILQDRELYDAVNTYVYDGDDPRAWISLLANGYRFDFRKSYVCVVPGDLDQYWLDNVA